MKLLVVLTLLSVSLGQQKDEPVATSCYVGRQENGGVMSNETQTCDFNKKMSCQTKIELNAGLKFVDRQCKKTQACEQNTKNNPQNCYGSQAVNKNIRVCFYCCTEDLCNKSDEIKVIPKVEPLMDFLQQIRDNIFYGDDFYF